MSTSELDISQLNESQQTALQTYTSVTDQEPLTAIPILQRAEWNVQIAIARFFDGEPTSDPVAEARAALPAPSSRQATNLQYESLLAAARPGPQAVHGPETVNRIPINSSGEAQYRPPFILSALFTPINILWRVFATVVSRFSFLLPSFIPRFLARIAASFRSRPSRRSLPPADNARRFIREFSEEYGSNGLPFAENGFNLCLDNAKGDLKFLLVVLLSPSHDDNSSWVRETLLSPQFTQFLAAHREDVVMWGGNVQDAEAYQVSDALGCTKFPFVALLSHTSESGSTGMSVVCRAAGPATTSELVAKLAAAITANENALAATRASRREQQASRNLRQEQDSAYERSLAQDRERARKRKEEAEATARAEKEALNRAQAEQQKAADRMQWRTWRAESLRPEPDPKSKDSIRISIRLPSGERVIRRFSSEADLEELYAFVECYDITKDTASSEKSARAPIGYSHKYEFKLVSPMPRRVFDLDSGALGETVGNGANLIVEPVADED